MRIGILTRRAGYNHGSSLQAYAMARFISNLGFLCNIIDYNEYAPHFRWKIRPAIENLMWAILRRMPSIAKRVCNSRYQHLCIRNIQQKKFRTFEQQFMPLTKERCSSSGALCRISKQFEAIVCGSDQIWNPAFFDPAFFLEFVPPNSKILKIAYAPSIGITNKALIPKREIDLLKRFDAISCREKEGAQLLRHIADKPVSMVLDPTLMVSVDDWKSLCSPIATNEKGYILVYFLHSSCYEDNIPHNFIKELREETGLPIYNIKMHNLINNIEADKHFEETDPCEFLYLLQHATWICTNSFHCSIFSFLFQKKFFVFERFMKGGNEGNSQNSRIRSLLEIFNMPQCLKKESDIPKLDQEFDFEMGIKKLQAYQQESKDYLISALNSHK